MLLAKESIRIFEVLVEELKHTSKKAIKVEEFSESQTKKTWRFCYQKGISNEQVCILVARDRNKTILSNRVDSGRILVKQIDTTITSYF